MSAPRSTDRRAPLAVAVLASAFALVVLVLWGLEGWKLRLGALLPEGAVGEAPLWQMRALASLLFFIVFWLGWGELAARALRLPLERLPALLRVSAVFLLGHIASALVLFVVGSLGLLPWGTWAVVLGAAGLPRVWNWRWDKGENHGRDARATLNTLLWLVPAGVAALLAFLAALAPVVESDGLRYQLFGPQEWLKQGSLAALPYHAFTNLPAQTNLLYMAVMPLGGERAAQLVHWSYLPLIVVFGGALGRAVFRALCARLRHVPEPPQERAVAVASGVLAVSAPVVLVLAAWPFVDLSTAAFLLAALWAALPGSMGRAQHRLLLSGLFAGAAIATKLTALIAVGLLGLALLPMILASARRWRLLLAFAVPVALIPAPWLVKNLIYHGNPVYPAGFGVFGDSAGEWTAEADAFYKSKAAEKGIGHDAPALIHSPADVTFNWIEFEAHNPGPTLLALAPVALIGLVLLRRRPGTLLLVFAGQILLGWLAWFFTYQSVRFLLVPLALVSASGAATLMFLAGRHWRWAQVPLLVLALAGIAWHGAYILAGAGGGKRPVAAGLGLVAGEQYRAAAGPNSQEAIAYLNATAAPGKAVFFIGEHRGLGAQFPVLTSDWFDVPRVLAEIRATPDNAAMIRRWRTELGVRYVLFNWAELSQYFRPYYRPRFTPAEWERHQALLDWLLPARVFEARPGVFVIDLERARGTPPNRPLRPDDSAAEPST